MNLALDEFADNPIIDELVCWPPRTSSIQSVRACCVLFRQPFVEVALANGDVFQRHFERRSFPSYWAEAQVILETLTAIELITEFEFEPVAERDALVTKILSERDACIAESNKMYAAGMYAQFLMQYGEDCKDLPADAMAKIAAAKRRLAADP